MRDSSERCLRCGAFLPLIVSRHRCLARCGICGRFLSFVRKGWLRKRWVPKPHRCEHISTAGWNRGMKKVKIPYGYYWEKLEPLLMKDLYSIFAKINEMNRKKLKEEWRKIRAMLPFPGIFE